VFARSAEQYILRGVIAEALARGAARLVGEYQPTAKNDVVAGLYSKLGFTPSDDTFFVREVDAGTDDLVTHIGAVF
jgi:predicted enzyme involved in methoxymalonyl-ACP biosynthesis